MDGGEEEGGQKVHMRDHWRLELFQCSTLLFHRELERVKVRLPGWNTSVSIYKTKRRG